MTTTRHVPAEITIYEYNIEVIGGDFKKHHDSLKAELGLTDFDVEHMFSPNSSFGGECTSHEEAKYWADQYASAFRKHGIEFDLQIFPVTRPVEGRHAELAPPHPGSDVDRVIKHLGGDDDPLEGFQHEAALAPVDAEAELPEIRQRRVSATQTHHTDG